MSTSTSPPAELALAPLGAGDLIDRTVRLYRRHFTTLLRAAAPPVVVSALGSVMLTVGWRELSLTESGARLALYGALIFAGLVLAWGGNFAFLLVMGGASRNLVLHLLRGEPVSARAIYRAVRSRFWSLVGALILIILFAGAVSMPIGFAWLMLVGLGVGGVMAITQGSAFGIVLAIILFVAFTLAALFAFFFVVGRVAYVPQVILVEGRKATEAFGRSMSLARGNVRRLTAMFLFTTFATYSALMLLAVPLGWYGYLRGVNPLTLNDVELPLWYAIGRQVLTQVASILLAPVWMLGLSLLYVDERVRHEGYDIELMAQQRLGDMPELPGGGAAPLAPAVYTAPAPAHAHAPRPRQNYPQQTQPAYAPQATAAAAAQPRTDEPQADVVDLSPPTRPGSIFGLDERPRS
ncbi:MAG: hypothetical protein LC785_10950 [Acidobacteria bacterium]|nr:hypothetical protein [Acidobacteriota bacterium]MCA1642444.1 hypothetical protein [Acidobacteriota bacterium]